MTGSGSSGRTLLGIAPRRARSGRRGARRRRRRSSRKPSSPSTASSATRSAGTPRRPSAVKPARPGTARKSMVPGPTAVASSSTVISADTPAAASRSTARRRWRSAIDLGSRETAERPRTEPKPGSPSRTKPRRPCVGCTVASISPPPAGYQPQRRSLTSARTPIRPSAGRYTSVRYGTGGLPDTWVPPTKLRREGSGAKDRGRSRAWNSNVTDPALPWMAPMSKRWSPPRSVRGLNRSSVDPSASPTTSASLIAARARTTVRCWGRSPGFGRAARIPVRATDRPSSTASERAVRRICPPPSPRLPSSVNTGAPVWPLPGILPNAWSPRSSLRPLPSPTARSHGRHNRHNLRGRCDRRAWRQRLRFRLAEGTSERPRLRAPDGHDAAGVRNGHTYSASPVGETLPQWDTSGTPRLFSGEGWIARGRTVPACSPPARRLRVFRTAVAGEPATALKEVRRCGIQSDRSGATSEHGSRGMPGARPRSSSL